MSELRDRLEACWEMVRRQGDEDSPSLELLAAIVDRLEPEERRNVWRLRPEAEANLITINADVCPNKESEAQAEMERLRHQRDEAAANRNAWKRRCEEAEAVGDLVKSRFEWMRHCKEKEVDADAEIGRLVRGMRPWTRFTKGSFLYWASRNTGDEIETAEGWVCAHEDGCAVQDPAEALRAIQKEDEPA